MAGKDTGIAFRPVILKRSTNFGVTSERQAEDKRNDLRKGDKRTALLGKESEKRSKGW